MNEAEADEMFLVAMYELLRANGAFPGLDPAKDPVSIFRRMKAEESPAVVRRATKEGIADVLEMTQDLDGEGLASVDQYLVKRGAPSLTGQRLGRRRWVERLLDRGVLVSDEECRGLMNRLNDTADRRWTAAQRDRANELVTAYQQRIRK